MKSQLEGCLELVWAAVAKLPWVGWVKLHTRVWHSSGGWEVQVSLLADSDEGLLPVPAFLLCPHTWGGARSRTPL